MRWAPEPLAVRSWNLPPAHHSPQPTIVHTKSDEVITGSDLLTTEDSSHRAHPMPATALGKAQQGFTAYVRSHKGKNRAGIQIQADLVD